jgi:ubiquitin carboxyl-terminal hydrolase 5/13
MEFFTHLLELLDHEETSGPLTSALFAAGIQKRTQCSQSNKVMYASSRESILQLPIPISFSEYAAFEAKRQKTGDATPSSSPEVQEVPFTACLSAAFGGEILDGFMSPATGTVGQAVLQQSITSFPKVLCVQLRRYVVSPDGGWQPVKLNVAVDAPLELDLTPFYACEGPQSGEELLEAAAPAPAPSASTSSGPQPKAEIVAAVESMGFSNNAARKAALAVGNSSAEAASMWVLDHMSDPTLNDAPVLIQASSASGPAFSAEQYAAVEAMGFPRDVCHLALKRANGNTERAAEWILSNMCASHPFISHSYFSANSLCMDDLERLVVVDAQETAATASSSVGGAAAAAPAADPGNKNGQYRLFAMVSHLGKNTSSGGPPCRPFPLN